MKANGKYKIKKLTTHPFPDNHQKKNQNLSSKRYRHSKTKSGEILPKQIF